MKSSLGFGLGRPVQRVLQGTHLIQRNLVNDTDSAVGGTSPNGTHRAPPSTPARIDEAVALPSPPVVLSARLDRYYGHLRRPPGWLPLPSSSPVIGRDAPPASRNRMGRGGPLQFPPPLSERSEPLTPGSPSRLHFQDLHRFHGLRPLPSGSALPCPTHTRAGVLTTRQASLTLRTARLHTPHIGMLDAGLRHRPFPDDIASLLPGLLTVTRTGLSPASDDELANQPSTIHTINHQPFWTHRQASLDVTDRSVAHPAQRGARRWASTPPVSRRHRQPATGPPDSY